MHSTFRQHLANAGSLLSHRRPHPRQLAAAVRHQHQNAPSTHASSSSTDTHLNAAGSTGSSDPRTTHFGFQTVPEAAKESLVRNVFDSVASSYDVMNDAMSMGVHRLWKDDFVSRLRPGARGPLRCIDVAGGTGDIALRILDFAREKYADRETSVDVVDINGEMLKEGFMRFKKTMYHNTPQIAFKEANAQNMPESEFPANTYDLYTIAFGIRNCTSIPDVLKEAHRVLKPGGTFACLEFSRVNNPLFRTIYDQYSFSIIPLLGTILAGDRASYQYLVESIRRFPPQPEFAQMIQDAGFSTGAMHEGKGGAWTDLWDGIASIHTGVKL
ncbi:ubiE/COQ5 methyltransferase family-domain-containing protein [Daedaleopsis nitida]|nr:ubiE/COQ5 methyltransferase family-domain-containing protein [Daedaleopsis nitida]